MANWIVMLCRNNLNFTKKALESCLAQDIEGDVKVRVINNGSTDGTSEWLESLDDWRVFPSHHFPGKSVAKSWNDELRELFKSGYPHVLVVNNDIVLRPDTYRRLVEDGGGFVTAVGNDNPESIKPLPGVLQIERKLSLQELHDRVYAAVKEDKRPHPDFSCYLIRKEVWDKVGEFDEVFTPAFGEDCDYHVRMHEAGVKAECIDLPFYHYGSATIKHMEPEEATRLHLHAELNRAYFERKWGFKIGSPLYEEYFLTPKEAKVPGAGEELHQDDDQEHKPNEG